MSKFSDIFWETVAWITLPIWAPWWFLFSIFEPGEKTVKIAILGGSKGCGKSELWNQLRRTKNPEKATEQTEIESFVLGKKRNGEEVIVETTKDFGGGELYVRFYEEIINSDGVFIYFLIDLRNIKRDADIIRARLRKITTIIEKGKYENCGICIIGTFYDKFRGVLGLKDKEDAKNEIWKVLNNGHKNIKGLDKDKLNIRIINTTDQSDIEEIRKEILATLD